MTSQRVRVAGAAVAVGLAGFAVFQLALAAGAPLGRAAWGGEHAELPSGLRWASLAAVGFYVLAELVVLKRAGYAVPWVSDSLARPATWLLGVLLTLAGLANLVSQSPWERFLNGPVALVLAVLTFVVAHGHESSRLPSDHAGARVGRPA